MPSAINPAPHGGISLGRRDQARRVTDGRTAGRAELRAKLQRLLVHRSQVAVRYKFSGVTRRRNLLNRSAKQSRPAIRAFFERNADPRLFHKSFFVTHEYIPPSKLNEKRSRACGTPPEFRIRSGAALSNYQCCNSIQISPAQPRTPGAKSDDQQYGDRRR